MDVLIQALNGTWERCGVDRLAGVIPENVQASANKWGSDRASFKLRRRADGVFPDIGAFTPVQLHQNGQKCWTGRVAETPISDADGSVVSVECEGKQYHLDDDIVEKTWVHSQITDWKDARSQATAVLGTGFGQMPAAYQVQSEAGVITLAHPLGSTASQATGVVVILDLGPNRTAKRLIVDWTASAAAAGFSLYGYSLPTFDDRWYTGGVIDSAFAAVPLAVGPTTSRGSFATGYRYVVILMYYGNATAVNATDVWVRLNAIKVFTNTAYESADASILTADTVIKDAVSLGTQLLSSDVSRVTTPSPIFYIPHLAPAAATPRELINSVNSLHDMVTMIDTQDRMVFEPRPTVAALKVGAWAGCTFEDAAANSGDEIYNRAIVNATGPDGSPLRVERLAAQQAGAPIQDLAAAFTNPAFDTNLTGWNYLSSSRDTVNFHSSPGALRQNVESVTTTLNGPFTPGIYRLSWWTKANAIGDYIYAYIDPPAGRVSRFFDYYTQATSTAWTENVVYFAILAGCATALLTLSTPNSSGLSATIQYHDDFRLGLVTATIPDRRGFRRTKIVQTGAAITTTIGSQLADVFLKGHRVTPQKGTVKVTGAGVRRVLTDETVDPALLLRETNKLLRLSHRLDPDTGALGRDATMSTVTYDDDAQTATIALDSDRDQLDTLLARYALIAGQVS